MKEITIKANAKINLAIDVLDKLDNGYHKVDMIIVPLLLHDTIEVTRLANNYNTYLYSNDEKIPCDETNLAYKALNLLKNTYNFDDKFKIYIYKRIPVEAGLGGGSSDAAAILKNIPALLANQSFEKVDPLTLAPQIGSDVSFFINNRPARATEKGNVLTDIKIKIPYHVLIVKPKQGLSTKEVYTFYDEIKEKIAHPNIDKLIEGLENDDAELIQANLINVLTVPAISKLPLIKKVLNSFENMNLSLYGMSGTGSACFALSKDKKYLRKVEEVFQQQGYQVFLTQFDLSN